MDRSACRALGLWRQSRSRMIPPPTEVNNPHRTPDGTHTGGGGRRVNKKIYRHTTRTEVSNPHRTPIRGRGRRSWE